jgi:phenylacetate-coenzyme A ligase PaaK-like adenylate-forming protein
VVIATKIELAALRAFFPNAAVADGYSLSEIDGGVGKFCYKVARSDFESESAYFHPYSRIFLEVVNPSDGSPMPYGKEGEFVVTHLDIKSPFPIIRYRTGDRGIIKPSECECGVSKFDAMYLGRLRDDIISVSGAVLTKKDLEDAISKMDDLVHPKFIAKIYQTRNGWKVKSRISLSLFPKEDRIEKAVIATRFNQLLSLSPRFNLEDAIKTGVFDAPEIIFMPESEYKNLKESKLINGLIYS